MAKPKEKPEPKKPIVQPLDGGHGEPPPPPPPPPKNDDPIP